MSADYKELDKKLDELEVDYKELYECYESHYNHLRAVFDSITETLLGEDYYNYGMDWFSCDELTGEDIVHKYELFGYKKVGKYRKILKDKLDDLEKED